MREILQDATWQAIGAIFTIAAIGVSILIYRLQKQRRKLTYREHSSYLLLRSDGELHGRIVVNVDGVSVENVGVLFLEVQNSGNVPIARADFDVPFSIQFREGVVVISATVEREDPSNLGAVLENIQRGVQLRPLLMNPADKISVKFLLAGSSLDFEVGGRVIGVKAIKPANAGEGFAWRAIVGMLLIAGGIALALSNAPARSDPLPKPPAVLWGIGIAIFGYVFLSFALLRGNRLPRLIRRMARAMEKLQK